MSRSSSKTFDCVQSMRETRNRLSVEIAKMKYDELVQWLRAHRYSDPVLQRLAEKAAQQGDAAADAARRR